MRPDRTWKLWDPTSQRLVHATAMLPVTNATRLVSKISSATRCNWWFPIRVRSISLQPEGQAWDCLIHDYYYNIYNINIYLLRRQCRPCRQCRQCRQCRVPNAWYKVMRGCHHQLYSQLEIRRFERAKVLACRQRRFWCDLDSATHTHSRGRFGMFVPLWHYAFCILWFLEFLPHLASFLMLPIFTSCLRAGRIWGRRFCCLGRISFLGRILAQRSVEQRMALEDSA